MTYYDMSFPQAVYVANYFLTKVSKLDMECYIQLEYIDKELFTADTGVDLNYILQADQTQSTLPDVKAAALRKVYAYLCNTRCIDRDLVTHFLKQKYIGLDASNLLCFYTYRGDDVIAVAKKGINPRITFKQNLVREKGTGWWYSSTTTTEFKEVFVFESCVDLLSFLTLAKRGHIPKLPMEACYISLNGASTRYANLAEFYSTLFHELTHSTGHPKRLNRLKGPAFFGDSEYSKEELCAELGAAMLCGHCGIDNNEASNNSVAYLQNWLSALRNDMTLIVSAAAKAQRATDYILGHTYKETA